MMDVETQQNELVSENVRECYRGNENRIYGFPYVCVRRWRVCHTGNQAGNRRSKNATFDVTWYQTYALPKKTGTVSRHQLSSTLRGKTLLIAVIIIRYSNCHSSGTVLL